MILGIRPRSWTPTLQYPYDSTTRKWHKADYQAHTTVRHHFGEGTEKDSHQLQYAELDYITIVVSASAESQGLMLCASLDARPGIVMATNAMANDRMEARPDLDPKLRHGPTWILLWNKKRALRHLAFGSKSAYLRRVFFGGNPAAIVRHREPQARGFASPSFEGFTFVTV